MKTSWQRHVHCHKGVRKQKTEDGRRRHRIQQGRHIRQGRWKGKRHHKRHAMRAKTPMRQGGQCRRNTSNDNSSKIMAMTPPQCKRNTSAMPANTSTVPAGPSKANLATTPTQCWQQGKLDAGDDASVMRVRTPEQCRNKKNYCCHSIPYRTMYSVLTSIIYVLLEMIPLTGNIGPLNLTQRVVGIFVPSTLDVSDVYLALWAYCTDSTGRRKWKPVFVLETETRFCYGNGNPFPFPTLETKWIRVSVQIQTVPANSFSHRLEFGLIC
jgi:hypothetical protein